MVQHGGSISRQPLGEVVFYERLVKSVKLSLKKCLRNPRLNYDELSTTLVEVEAVLNSRPLTYL